MSAKIIRLTDKLSLKKFIWSNEDTKVAQSLMEEIKKRTLLAHPNYNKNFELECDASDRAIGCVLRQQEKILAFYSKKLTPTEARYTIVEKELLSIVRGLVFFKKIICNQSVKISTDNKNLMHQKLDGNKRYERWLTILQEFNYSIEHTRGNENTAADHLSRIAAERPQLKHVDVQKLADLQEKDQAIIERNNEGALQTKITENEISLFVDSSDRIVLPKFAYQEFVDKLHAKLGHPGPRKSMKTICKFYTGQGLFTYVMKRDRSCEDCQRNKTVSKTYGQNSGNIVGERPSL